MPTNGGGTPGIPARPRNSFPVQRRSDGIGRLSPGKGCKDSANDNRLPLVNAAASGTAFTITGYVITVSEASTRTAFLDPSALAAFRLLSQIPEEKRIHR